jgi:hypothetical protein
MNMDLEQIEELLRRYEDAETTIEEERLLEAYFNGAEIPQRFWAEKERFAYHTESRQETSALKFEDLIAAQPEQENRKPAIGAMRINLRMWSSMAAAIAVVIICVIAFRKNQGIEAGSSPSTQEKLAYEQTKHALWMISAKLNKGNDHIVRLASLSQAETKIEGAKNDK